MKRPILPPRQWRPASAAAPLQRCAVPSPRLVRHAPPPLAPLRGMPRPRAQPKLPAAPPSRPGPVVQRMNMKGLLAELDAAAPAAADPAVAQRQERDDAIEAMAALADIASAEFRNNHCVSRANRYAESEAIAIRRGISVSTTIVMDAPAVANLVDEMQGLNRNPRDAGYHTGADNRNVTTDNYTILIIEGGHVTEIESDFIYKVAVGQNFLHGVPPLFVVHHLYPVDPEFAARVIFEGVT